MKKIALGVAALSLSILASSTYAANTGAYVGAGLGWSKLETPNNVFKANRPDLSISNSRDIGGIGGRIFGGYNFNQYIGLEAGYNRYAQSKYKSSIFGGVVSSAKGSANYSMYAFDLVGKAYLPVAEGLNAYALGGIARVTSKSEYNISNFGRNVVSGSTTTAKFRPKYGAGISYDLPKSPVSTNLEFSRIQGMGNVKTNDKAIPNADMITIGLTYNFG